MPQVTRNHPKLTLEGGKAVLAAAERRAAELGVPMNIAIVDDGGHLLAFSRMDGAKLSSAQIAMTKAHASAIRRLPTGPAGGDPTSVLPSLSLALASHSHQTSLRGGVPIMADGECIGAIGVSNGTEEQDVDVAKTGAAALDTR
ncbi:MAG: GlcG/HbpS family heme-binding protein [Candidatus Acidiferrales bacterium]